MRPKVLKQANYIIKNDFQNNVEEIKVPKLSFMPKQKKESSKKIENSSLLTINSSNLTNITFQSINQSYNISNDYKNKNTQCENSINSEESFVAMLELMNDQSMFLACKNRPENQYIVFKDIKKTE